MSVFLSSPTPRPHNPPQVALEDIRIQIGTGDEGSGGVLNLHLSFRCDPKRVSAVMSKKKRTIEVLLHEVKEEQAAEGGRQEAGQGGGGTGD
jgi:hypothetical protein